jgi:pantoate--beta-alanine ligase
MRIVRSVAELRGTLANARRSGSRIGLVPTMGAFHEGHLSLMRRARAACDVVVVSLFLNPTQFGPSEDLAIYPRDEARDAELAAEVGVDLLFAPQAEEVYPPGFATTVSVGGITQPLEGAHRGVEHFDGVTTVVTKLLNMVGPDVAYFGQKDVQQALVIKRLLVDLDFPAAIKVCPTVREPDGLAMSSRNAYLTPADRARAVGLHRALTAAEQLTADGERSAQAVLQRARDVMRRFRIEPEYLALVDTQTLEPVEHLTGEALLAVAADVGRARLIDNTILR